MNESLRSLESEIKAFIADAYEQSHSNFLNKRPERKQQNIDRYINEKVSDFYMEELLNNAWAFYESNSADASEVNRLATQEELTKLAPTKAVESWILPQLDGILGDVGIYNGKDPFTTSGRDRTFRELHYEYSAENIVRAISRAKAKGADAFGLTSSSLIGNASTELRSVADMHTTALPLATAGFKRY